MIDTVKLIEFNYSPAIYTDSSWLSDVAGAENVIKEMHKSSMARPWLSRFILKRFAIDSQFDFDFDDKLKQVALFDKTELVTAIFFAGLCLNAYWIRNIIRREHRQSVISCIGEDGYIFASKKAPYISGQLGDHYPTQFQVDWAQPENLKKHIFRTGLRLTGFIFSKENEAFRHRFLLKFPSASKQYFEDPGVKEAEGDKILKLSRTVFKKLLKDLKL